MDIHASSVDRKEPVCSNNAKRHMYVPTYSTQLGNQIQLLLYTYLSAKVLPVLSHQSPSPTVGQYSVNRQQLLFILSKYIYDIRRLLVSHRATLAPTLIGQRSQ